MNDRRRINGPSGGTSAPVFATTVHQNSNSPANSTVRTRRPLTLRKLFLRTGVTPSASGSAYLELDSSGTDINKSRSSSGASSLSGLKLTCTVHGPRPLPRSAPFTPTIILTTHVKYAPFATTRRRGYVRDAVERDLAVHLETALRGVIIGDRWQKSGLDVVVTVIEGEEDQWRGTEQKVEHVGGGPWGIMSVLSGCITVASAAIADAGIDCLDMICGGISAMVQDRKEGFGDTPPLLVLDPVPSEHAEILAACVVGYLPSRDEITDLWIRGNMGRSPDKDNSTEHRIYQELADSAVKAAFGAHLVLTAALTETAEMRASKNCGKLVSGTSTESSLVNC